MSDFIWIGVIVGVVAAIVANIVASTTKQLEDITALHAMIGLITLLTVLALLRVYGPMVATNFVVGAVAGASIGVSILQSSSDRA